MASTEDQRRAHWQGVYAARAPTEVSWFQSRPDVALDFIRSTQLPLDAAILDAGGGASTLADHLLEEGRTCITVVDLSQRALQLAQARLGAVAGRVTWIAADITTWRPDRRFDLWHDRAVLHFMTEALAQAAYADTLRAALKPGGWVLIAGFAPGGPLTCSGLEIVQHDARSLQALLGPRFDLIKTRDKVHRTPFGAEQAFRHHLFRRA